jgi:DnaJ-domain-containing protein 1
LFGVGWGCQCVAFRRRRRRASDALDDAALSGQKTHAKTIKKSPSASASEVKRAYRELMREMHPDASAGAGGPDSTELATLLNEIYRVSFFWCWVLVFESLVVAAGGA